jgi:hypothetical protein
MLVFIHLLLVNFFIYKIVIRNLHFSTISNDIIKASAELGHSVKFIYNVKNKNKYPLSLLFVDMLTQDNNKDILEIKSLLNTKISIEKPHKKKHGPPQYHNCQSYEDTRNNCHHELNCGKCGNINPTNECSKDRHNPAKFALCNEKYTANYKGYPVYKALHKKTVPKVTPVKNSDFNAQSKTKLTGLY